MPAAGGGCQGGDSGKEPAAMADRRHADGDQVLARQVGQESPSTSLSRNASSYCSRPSCRSQLATSIAIRVTPCLTPQHPPRDGFAQ